MNERCDNCGTELFAGQQFCRQCGAPTRQLSAGEVPTQILPGGQGQQPPPTAGQSHAATTPLSARDTDDVYRSRVAQFLNPPPAPIAPMSTMSLEGGKRSSWRGWLIAIVCVLGFLVVGSIFAARYAAQQFARKVVVVNNGRQGTRVEVPPLPPMPDMPPMPSMDASESGDEETLDESGAQVSGDETNITRTFAMKDGTMLSLVNASGDISVESWDGEEAQVKITKRGGSAEEREEVEIMQRESDEGLSLRTSEHSDEVKGVNYEIKLPRGVRGIEIKSRDSNVTLANFAGDVSLNVLRGDFSLKGLTGTVAARTMKGDISVNLKNATPKGPQSLNAVSGNITLNVGGANAELKAETISGGVNADNDFGLSVEKRVAGEHAAGTLGKGGEPIVAKTVSGDIKIKH